MAIRTDYTITDSTTQDDDGLADVSVTKTYDGEQDADVLTLNQNGQEIVVTLEMANDLVDVIGKLRK